MLKFDRYKVVFQEIPNEVSLSFSITGCKNNCSGCHSPYLREDIGNELTEDILTDIIKNNKYITCILFFGGDHDKEYLKKLVNTIRSNFNLKIALYSGNDIIDNDLYNIFDYIKIGSYNKDKGPLKSKTTNQCLINTRTGEDITYMFWNK